MISDMAVLKAPSHEVSAQMPRTIIPNPTAEAPIPSQGTGGRGCPSCSGTAHASATDRPAVTSIELSEDLPLGVTETAAQQGEDGQQCPDTDRTERDDEGCSPHGPPVADVDDPLIGSVDSKLARLRPGSPAATDRARGPGYPHARNGSRPTLSHQGTQSQARRRPEVPLTSKANSQR